VVVGSEFGCVRGRRPLSNVIGYSYLLKVGTKMRFVRWHHTDLNVSSIIHIIPLIIPCYVFKLDKKGNGWKVGNLIWHDSLLHLKETVWTSDATKLQKKPFIFDNIVWGFTWYVLFSKRSRKLSIVKYFKGQRFLELQFICYFSFPFVYVYISVLVLILLRRAG